MLAKLFTPGSCLFVYSMKQKTDFQTPGFAFSAGTCRNHFTWKLITFDLSYCLRPNGARDIQMLLSVHNLPDCNHILKCI